MGDGEIAGGDTKFFMRMTDKELAARTTMDGTR